MPNFMLVSPNARFLWKMNLICLAKRLIHYKKLAYLHCNIQALELTNLSSNVLRFLLSLLENMDCG